MWPDRERGEGRGERGEARGGTDSIWTKHKGDVTWPMQRRKGKPTSLSQQRKGKLRSPIQQRTRFACGMTATLRQRRGFTPRLFRIRPSALCTAHRQTSRTERKATC